MPVIRVEIPAGTPAGTQESIRTAVKAAVLKTLAPKETKYDYVAVRETVGVSTRWNSASRAGSTSGTTDETRTRVASSAGPPAETAEMQTEM